MMSNSGAFSVVIDRKNYNVNQDHSNYRELFDCLKGGEDCESNFLELYDIRAAVEIQSNGNFAVVGDEIHYKGKPVHPTISRYVSEISSLGLSYDNVVRFIENLYENVSKRATEELFGFMQHKGLPITEDGCIIAWKAVTCDFRDKWTGKIDNTPGSRPSMPRNEIDETAHCGPGFHGGSLQFCSQYGYGDDIVIQIKIDPRHVVNIPFDSECQKIRFSDYEVLRVFDHPLNVPTVTSDGHMYEDEEDEEDDQDDMCLNCGEEYRWCDCGAND